MKQIGEEIAELPDWVTGRIGICPKCKKESLIILLRKRLAGIEYEHCIECNSDFYEWEKVGGD